MKKVKAIIFTIWYISAVILAIAAPFIFNTINEWLLVLNVVIPAVVLISDDEIIDMEIF